MSLENIHFSATIEWSLLSKLLKHDFARYCSFSHNAPKSEELQFALADLDYEFAEILVTTQLETLLLIKDEALGLEPDETAYHCGHNNISQRVYNILKDFCFFLEERVNPVLIGSTDRDDDFAYQKLQLLLDRTESTNLSNANPIDPQSTPSLFAISKSSAIQAAFTSESSISEVLEQQILHEIDDWRAILSWFNALFNPFQIPEKDDEIPIYKGLLKSPNKDTTSSLSSFKQLRKLQQRTTTARRVIFDNFNYCSQKEKGRQHEVFFQLPSWENVSDYHSRDAPQEELPQLFFIRCSETRSKSNDWCHARMHLLP